MTAPTSSAAGRPARGLVKSLVGIRGVAAALVVSVHLAPFASALTPGTTPFWDAIWHHAYVALDLFFVLSGYVISSGYRHTFARWPGWGTFGRFLWARLSRFYPVHLAVLAVMVAAVVGGRLVGREIPHGGDLGVDLLRQVTLTSGWGGADKLTWNGPVWSLSAEWFCYLLWPLVLPLVVRLRRPAAVIALYLGAIAAMLAIYAVIGFTDPMITYVMPLPRALGGFVAGAALCQLHHVDSRLPDLAARATGPIVVVALAAVVGAALLGWSTMVALPLVGLVVLALGGQRGRVDAFLASRPLMYAGEISVAVFLVHVPFLLAAALVVTPARFPGAWGWLGVVLLVAGILVAAWLALVLVERPGQRLMRSLIGRPRKAPAVPADIAAERVTGGSGPVAEQARR